MNKSKLKQFLVKQVKKHSAIEYYLKSILKEARPTTTVFLDFPVYVRPRYNQDQIGHSKLHEIIGRNRVSYREYLQSFLAYESYYVQFLKNQSSSDQETKPIWLNGYLPPLDGATLYGMIALIKPRRYFEIGSGNSTKFVRQAIKDHELETTITSFDPTPRAEIDAICDKVIRQPVENVDLEVFDALEAGDILFIDGSHCVFMNSDATVTFLDILPRLKPGVIVEFHDIFLPFDYPAEWAERYYSEQYMLAAYLLAEGEKFEILLPNAFISNDEELGAILSPLWKTLDIDYCDAHGQSFWIKIN